MAIFQGQVKECPSLWQLPEDVLRVSEWNEYKYLNEVGPRAFNLLAKIEFRCEWLRWREWCVAWPLRGRSCCRYASTPESGSIHQLSLQSKFLPSFREQYSPPNPESALIGRNLGWRNWIKIQQFSNTKIKSRISSAKGQPFCFSLSVLIESCLVLSILWVCLLGTRYWTAQWCRMPWWYNQMRPLRPGTVSHDSCFISKAELTLDHVLWDHWRL